MVAVLSNGLQRGKTFSNVEETMARGARVIAVAREDDEAVGRVMQVVLFVPKRIERTSKFARNLCGSLAFRLATCDSPRTLSQKFAVELDGYYRERPKKAPPPEFDRFLKLPFEVVSDPAARAGTRRSADPTVAGETDKASGGDDSG